MSWNGMAIYGALAAGAPLGFNWSIATLASRRWQGTTMVLPLLARAFSGTVRKCLRIRGATFTVGVVGLIWKPVWVWHCRAWVLPSSVRLFHFIFCQQWLDDGGIHPDRVWRCVCTDAHIVRLDAGPLWRRREGRRCLVLVETAGLLLLWLAPTARIALGRRGAHGAGCSLIFPGAGRGGCETRTCTGTRYGTLGGYAAFQDISLQRYRPAGRHAQPRHAAILPYFS